MKLNNLPITGSYSWEKLSDWLNYNFNAVGVSTSKFVKGNKGAFKGLYTTFQQLLDSNPYTNPGDFALIINGSSSSSFSMYYVTGNGMWEKTTDYTPKVQEEDYIRAKEITNPKDILR